MQAVVNEDTSGDAILLRQEINKLKEELAMLKVKIMTIFSTCQQRKAHAESSLCSSNEMEPDEIIRCACAQPQKKPFAHAIDVEFLGGG